MTVEHRIIVEAHPEILFRIYADVGHWHTWDPDTRQASLDGPFAAGTRGRLTLAKGRAVSMRLAEVVPNKSFAVECRVPFFRMRFERTLRSTVWGTEVLHRVTFGGLLARLIGPRLSRQLDSRLPVTLAGLKVLAESTAAA